METRRKRDGHVIIQLYEHIGSDESWEFNNVSIRGRSIRDLAVTWHIREE